MKQHPIYKFCANHAPDVTSVSLTDTAKLIRHTLKRRFSGVKFSVRSERYAGGSSIHVKWTDGPRLSTVESVISPYVGAGFDGTIDMRYLKGAWLYPDGSAGFRCTEGTEESGGIVPITHHLPTDSEAVAVSFSVSYILADRRQSVAYVADMITAYAETHTDALSDAIKAGTVYAAGDDNYGGFAYGANNITVFMVDHHHPVWGEVALHRFDHQRHAAS